MDVPFFVSFERKLSSLRCFFCTQACAIAGAGFFEKVKENLHTEFKQNSSIFYCYWKLYCRCSLQINQPKISYQWLVFWQHLLSQEGYQVFIVMVTKINTCSMLAGLQDLHHHGYNKKYMIMVMEWSGFGEVHGKIVFQFKISTLG